MSEVQNQNQDHDFLATEWWTLLNVPQTGHKWLSYRRGRPTGSIVGSIAGHSRFTTQDEELEYMLGIKKKVFTPQQIKNMAHGTAMEDPTRLRYMQQNGQIALELGLVLANWDDRLGASVDGVVISPEKLGLASNEVPWQESGYNIAQVALLAEGIIEIKCPVRMYRPLINYHNRQVAGQVELPSTPVISGESDIWNLHYNHIWPTHFDQMQQGMAILRKPWCDYIVYADDMMLVNRIPYCHAYYVQQILKPVKKFLKERLDPQLPAGYRLPLPPAVQVVQPVSEL